MKINFRWVIGLLCVLYAGMRLWRLAEPCLWFDEIFSIHAAEHDWPGMLRFAAQDLVHPPLFYALLKIWIEWIGESVFWLRLLPVAFSVLALVPFLYLCRELKLESRAAALALFLFAMNGSLIKYSQTLRMYSLLLFLSLMSIWLFARYFNRGKSWIWLVIVNLFLVYTHYFGWLVIGAELTAILLYQRIKILRAIAMAMIALAGFVPWLVTVWNAARTGSDIGQNIAWQPRPGPGEIVTFLLDLAEPVYFQASSTEPGSIYLISVPLLIMGIAAIGSYLAGERSEEEDARVKWLVLFAAFPTLVGFAVSWVLPFSIWGTRHLIFVTPILLLLVSQSILGSRIRAVSVAAAASILFLTAAAAAVAMYRATTKYVWCAWDEVATDIVSKEPETNIYTFEDLAAYHLWFATRRSDGVRVSVITGVDALTSDGAYFLPRGFDGVTKVPIEQISGEEFWLAFRPIRRTDDARMIDSLVRLGYTSCTRNTAEYDRSRVIWLKMAKDPAACLAAGGP